MEKLNQEQDALILKQKNTSTIFYIWNSCSDVLQVSPMFSHVFGINPTSFTELKNVIFNDDLEKLESTLRASIDLSNIKIPLRMKPKDQDYTWFVAHFGKMGDGLISGTLDPKEMDDQQQDGDDAYLLQERRQFALEAANAGLWDWDVVSGKVNYDLKYISMLGYSPANFAQNFSDWSDKIHPDDYAETVKKQLQYVESSAYGSSFTCKYRMQTADGHYLWIWGQGKVLARDENGKALRLVGLHLDITEEEEAKRQLEFMAIHDVLTGLHNRSYFEVYFNQYDTHVLPAAYIIVDADGLKMINDCVNHAAGDLMLQKLAHTLRFAVRSADLLARIGGDEFAIFLQKTEEQHAIKIAKKIQDAIATGNEIEKGMAICASLGLACATTLEALLTLPIRADEAMVEQKKKQRKESSRKIKEWIGSLAGRSHTGYKDKRISHE